MTRSRAQAGFTLVELMVVVAIVGIMAIIGFPSFRGFMPKIRLNNSAMILSNDIALARVRAISKSSQFALVFTTGEPGRYTIWKYDQDPGETSPSWKSLGETLMPGTELFSVGGFFYDNQNFNIGDFPPAGNLVCSGSGRVNVTLNSAAVIELRTPSPGDFRKKIFVEPTGRIHVQKWSGGDWVEE